MKPKAGPFCATCGQSGQEGNENGEVISLKKCTRCRIVRYCSTHCQRKDFAKHNERCKIVHEASQKMSLVEEKIPKLNHDGKIVNLFISEFSELLKSKDPHVRNVALNYSHLEQELLANLWPLGIFKKIDF